MCLCIYIWRRFIHTSVMCRVSGTAEAEPCGAPSLINGTSFRAYRSDARCRRVFLLPCTAFSRLIRKSVNHHRRRGSPATVQRLHRNTVHSLSLRISLLSFPFPFLFSTFSIRLVLFPSHRTLARFDH